MHTYNFFIRKHAVIIFNKVINHPSCHVMLRILQKLRIYVQKNHDFYGLIDETRAWHFENVLS